MSEPPRFDAVVIGAGFAGLYMVKRLVDDGFTVRAYETGSDVGGTWYWNRYPGARCDLESVDYSYSFSPELDEEWQWSERYAAQPEILSYLNHVADRFGLRRHFVFGTTVTTAVFHEQCDRWLVSTDSGEQVEATYFILASGVVSTPKPPEIDGLNRFQGATYHTGRWPHEGVDFSGQRVGVIGTGSSGVQSIPLIAEQAERLVVFQRTANYTVPCLNHPVDASARERLARNRAQRRSESRVSRFGVPYDFPTVSALDVGEDERTAAYQRAWDDSHLLAFRLTYDDILTSEEANDTLAEFLRDKIAELVHDPDTAAALMPRSFPFGTKRPCLGTAYYETFNRDNVQLVDLRRSPIVSATTEGLETTDAAYQFDSLVFATGYDALTGAVLRIDIRGKDKVLLREQWASGPSTLLGLAVHNFPNLFLIAGPGSPGPLSNVVLSIEQHVEWISDCLVWMRDNGVARIEADADAERAWFAHVQEVVGQTLYLRADSWYLGANVPGKPRVFMPYIGGVGVFREKCDEVAARGYAGFRLSSAVKSGDVTGAGA